MHPFALMKCIDSDLDKAALGLCCGVTAVIVSSAAPAVSFDLEVLTLWMIYIY